MIYKVNYEKLLTAPLLMQDAHKRALRSKKFIVIPNDKIKDGFFYINPHTGLIYERRVKNTIALPLDYLDPYLDCLEFFNVL